MSFIIKKRGSASIEFVWATIVFVLVMMTIFKYFSMTMQSSGRLVRSRYAGFSLLDKDARGLIYADDAASFNDGNVFISTQNCVDDCENKLDFKAAGTIDQNLVIYLQPK